MAVPERADTEGWAAVASVTGMRSGTRVLDVGCGTGGFCRYAAGLGAVVAGVDIAEGHLVDARRRAPSADLRHAAMERLPWLDESFDLVTGFNAFQYALDPGGALREAARVVRPGGSVVVCRWGPPRSNELFGLIALVQQGRLPELTPADRTADLEAVVVREHAALVAAGLAPSTWGTVERPAVFPDDAATFSALRRAGAVGLGSLSAADVSAMLGPFRREDGSVVLRNVLVYVAAERVALDAARY
jgi:SAM-dependent methyltransferase